MRIRIPAYAKINLTLDVLGTLPNGYHELRMVMQSISLHDTLSLETETDEGIVLRCNMRGIPCDERNLVHKAIRAFYDATGILNRGVSVVIDKHIPMMAGLAGGSTDAAATLRALNYAHNARLTDAELIEIGVRVGADVPFCIVGGTQLAGGVGEKLTPLPDLADCTLLLVKPAVSVSTPAIFAALDRVEITRRPNADAMADALARGSVADVAAQLYNVMEPVTAAQHPEISALRQTLLDSGALGAVMSGSGPTVFGIFDDRARAEAAYAALLPEVESVHLCHPMPENRDADILTPDNL